MAPRNDHRGFRAGDPSAVVGPFAETKEHLAGFYLIEAQDLNEAIHWAAKIPPARFGSIEVRPMRRDMVLEEATDSHRERAFAQNQEIGEQR